MLIKAKNCAEEIQSYIADNSGLGLVVGTASANFTLGNILDITDLDQYLSSSPVVLTMFEEGGDSVSSHRNERIERTFRFLYKGSYGQEAINRCWDLLKYLWDLRKFETSTFSIWLMRKDKLPGIVAASQSGVYLADIVVTFLVSQKTG